MLLNSTSNNFQKEYTTVSHDKYGENNISYILSSGPRGRSRVVGVAKRSPGGSLCLCSSVRWLTGQTQVRHCYRYPEGRHMPDQAVKDVGMILPDHDRHLHSRRST